MKIITTKALGFVPASHEDPTHPGAVKKVLFTKNDFNQKGRIQMINWGRLPKGKSFRAHYHEDMDEVFVMISGVVKLYINYEEAIIKGGDAIIVPLKSIHKMVNVGKGYAEYLVIGVSLGTGGKTIVSQIESD